MATTNEPGPSTAPQARAQVVKALRSSSVVVGAVVISLIIGAIILAVSGANPLEAYLALLRGAFGSMDALGRTLEKATPLIFGGLSVAFAFKAGLFNIGGQGQLLFGALTAAVVGYQIEGLPFIIHMPLAFMAGAVAGFLYGAIPGALKTYTGAHEVITTIMLNFVATNITDYLTNTRFKDPSTIITRTPAIAESAAIPRIGTLPLGFFIAVAICLLTWWILMRTTLGYEIRTVGLNSEAARYAGMKVSRTIILTMAIAGLLAGIGGSVETLGVDGRYEPGFNVGLGFDGITIALLGKTSPIGVIPAALLVGVLKAGSSQMQFDAGVAAEITDVLQALMLFFVAADAIVRYIIRVRAEDGEQLTLGGKWGG
jgi:simple sugar transport system permease protein